MSVEIEPIEQRDAVATEAVAWFLRIEQEEPTLEVLAEWQRWLEISPLHRTAYEATQRTWTALDNVSVSRWLESPEDAGMLPPSSAAKAAKKPRGRRFVWPAVASFSMAAALAFLGVRVMTADSYRTTIQTAIAEHREIILPDQSHVLVGASSAVEIKLTSHRREVRLVSGEAFFSVAQDTARPFVVNAGVSKVTALGTAFNVRRYGDAVAVEVAEGRVKLEPATMFKLNAGATAVLDRGEETVVEANGAVQAVRAVPAQSVAAWRNGRHSYIDEPLSVVIADLNRYSTRPVIVDNETLAQLRITTTFFSNDWRGWLHTLVNAAPALEIREEADALRIVPKAVVAIEHGP